MIACAYVATIQTHSMKVRMPEREDTGWNAAEAALAAAKQLPSGPERVAALKKAGRLRFEADERRRPMRDQEGDKNSN
jgi:hypothetical protein